MSETERVTVRLPKHFEPAKHGAQLIGQITKRHGEGFEIETVNLAAGEATAVRAGTITEVVTTGDSQTKSVKLARTVKPSDGEKLAAKFSDQYGQGWEMTRFEPFLGRAVLTKMDPEVSQCRRAVASALGCKPWDLQVRARRDGGYDLQLPNGYMPSKHEGKLEEVATDVVGRFGWFVKTDPLKLTASILPGVPPTFPELLPAPMGERRPFEHWDSKAFLIPLGQKLSEPGSGEVEEFALDMNAGAHTQLAGLSGAGKSVLINTFIAQWLSRSAELVIIDLPTKSVDFEWCKDFVRPGGWGCSSDAEAATAIRLVLDEGERRAAVLKDAGVNNWRVLPREKALAPLVVVVDELTGLYALESVPKVTKNSPDLLVEMAEAAEQTNFFKELLKSGVKRVAAELRFAGVFLFIATQVASSGTGIPPALRTNLHHKILLGSKPTEGNRRLILSDPDRVPKIPDHIRDDRKASMGVGVAEPEGAEPTVFKGYFASDQQYRDWLERIGVPKPGNPHPTSQQMALIDSSLTEAGDEVARHREQMPDPGAHLAGESLGADGKPLKGAARAAKLSVGNGHQ